ncbi:MULTISPECIES: hypothetical protein [Bradyrhizobium]|uniref:hypothetical protein n=1 Tax=Bradyrhizobium TaxID=374 RepID=UPI0035DA51F0
MANAVQKIKLSPSSDIPFSKLLLSQKNVGRVKAGVCTDASGVAVVAKVLDSYLVGASVSGRARDGL